MAKRRLISEALGAHASFNTLNTVALVCGGNSLLLRLPHVVLRIHAFLDSIEAKWTLESASSHGLVRLLNALVKYEWSGVTRYFREQRFRAATARAVYNGNVDVLHWWMTTYLPEKQDQVASSLSLLAIEQKRLNVLQHLQRQGRLHIEPGTVVLCDSAEIAYWLCKHAPDLRLRLMLAESMKKGDIAFVRWAIDHQDVHLIEDMPSTMDEAAVRGYLEELQLLHELQPQRCTRTALGDVCALGFLETAKWLYKNYPKAYFYDPTKGSCDLTTVKWLVFDYAWIDDSNRVFWIERSIESASERHAFDVIEILISVQPNVQARKPISLASQCGDLPMATYLHKLGFQTDAEAMNNAAANGFAEIVVWLHRNRQEGCTTDAMDRAAAANHSSVVQWLHLNRPEGCTTNAMDDAAANGHFEMVKWLHFHRTEGCTTKAFDSAAKSGHFKMLQWLYEHRSEGCSSKALDAAASAGRLDILEYLESRGMKCTDGTAIVNAAGKGHFEIVQWLYKNDPAVALGPPLVDAVNTGQRDIVQFLAARFKEFADLNTVMEYLENAAVFEQFAVVEWLLKQAIPLRNVLENTGDHVYDSRWFG